MSFTLRILLWILVCSPVFSSIKAQQINLVPNPNFSEYDVCPPYLGQIHLAKAWDSPNYATTDFFHTCADSADGSGIPVNSFGAQETWSGEGYAGLRLWVPPGIGTPNQREYLTTQLLAPLEADSLYFISFQVSLADFGTHTTDAIGLGLSDTTYGLGRVHFFEPAIRRPEGQLLSQRTSWVEISGTYQARGGEEYLIIGNFLRDEDMNLVESPPDTEEEVLAAYIYIDGVNIRLAIPEDTLSVESDECFDLITFRSEQLDTMICDGEVLVFDNPVEADTYRWENGSRDPQRVLDESGLYNLLSINNCDTLSQLINLDFLNCDCEARLPANVMSPNGDGINDSLSFSLGTGATHIRWTIFDRWGSRLYFSDQRESSWDGRKSTELMPAGVYFWALEYKCFVEGKVRTIIEKDSFSIFY